MGRRFVILIKLANYRKTPPSSENLLGGVLLYLVLFCCLGGVKYKSVISMLADILVA